MAKGIVSVTFGIYPASMRVAPNSPSPLAKLSTSPANSPGQANGNDIDQNMFQRDFPIVNAAFSRLRSYCLNAADALWYINGKETTIAATSAPYHVKTICR